MSNPDLSQPQSNLVTRRMSEHQQQEQSDFIVRFWGVRGLIPTPGVNSHRYGGNTACLEMDIAGKYLIFDGGTGLRILGNNWKNLPQPIEAHLFFSNSQSNHIQGFPFFAPAFVSKNCFHIYGTAASNGASIKQCLCDQMLQPHFPYPLQAMQSELKFHNVVPGDGIEIDGIMVNTAFVNQNQKSIGFRVTWGNCSVAYVTDLCENMEPSDRDRTIELVRDVDLLIANAAYTPLMPRNYDDKSHWQVAVDLAKKVNAKQLVISHHHPDDSDEFLDEAQSLIQLAFPKGLLAREGLELVVNG